LRRQWLLRLAATAAARGGGCCGWPLLQLPAAVAAAGSDGTFCEIKMRLPCKVIQTESAIASATESESATACRVAPGGCLPAAPYDRTMQANRGHAMTDRIGHDHRSWRESIAQLWRAVPDRSTLQH